MNKGFLHEIVDLDDPFTAFADDLNDDISSMGYIDTGSYILNAAFSTSIFGGIPNNKVVAFAGESAVGKSYFALGILKNFLSENEGAGGIYYETEGAPTQVIKSRGLDAGRIIVSQPNTIEEFKTNVMKVLKKYEELDEESRMPLMIVLDSLGQLSTNKEMEDAVDGNNVSDMTRTRAIKSAFRTITLKLAKLKVPLILTNHTYTAITKYGAPQELGGGCLVKGTKVKTSENTTKEIQDFKKGDEVLTIFGKKRVIETYEFENKDIYEIEFEDGSIVKCSKEHKFLIDGKWIDAETIMDMVQSTKDININVSDIFGDIDVYKKQIYENLFSIDREKKKTYD